MALSLSQFLLLASPTIEICWLVREYMLTTYDIGRSPHGYISFTMSNTRVPRDMKKFNSSKKSVVNI